MELRQLEYFVAVAEEGNFTRAAARVHVAQPGVSAQIRRLEREFGEPLFDRSERTVRLTAVGAAVLPYARAALAAVAGARLAVDELAGLVSGRVAVGMLTSHNVPLADLLADFHQRHPKVEITLTEANSAEMVADLRHGRLDLALIGLAGDQPAGIHTQQFSSEPVVAAVGHRDRLAGRTSIGISALRDRALICLPPGTALRGLIDSVCAAAGFTPRIAFEASDPGILAQLAARGLGMAILPQSIVAARPADLHPIAITGAHLRGRIELAWRADGPTSPAARALIAYARTVLVSPE